LLLHDRLVFQAIRRHRNLVINDLVHDLIGRTAALAVCGAGRQSRTEENGAAEKEDKTEQAMANVHDAFSSPRKGCFLKGRFTVSVLRPRRPLR